MERVDYVDTFISVSADCRAAVGTPLPEKPDNPSVAARIYRMLAECPYAYTSDDVLFIVFADRTDIPSERRAGARVRFYATAQPCLRSSDLGKRYGWGIHADPQGRLALYGAETAEYGEFVSGQRRTACDAPLTMVHAMRSSRRGP